MKSWTVKELIKELSCYDEDFKVLIGDGKEGLQVVEEVDLYDEDIVVIK
jgi:hypothetical protein